MTTIYTVVPCPGSREDELRNLVQSLGLDRNYVVPVTTNVDTLRPGLFQPCADWSAPVMVPWRGHREIARWWNAGMERVRYLAHDRRETIDAVFFPNSDVRGHELSVERLFIGMRELGATMVGPDLHGGQSRVLGYPRTVTERVPGACFMIDGGYMPTFDEAFRWWYTDDDYEMYHRLNGWVALVSGTGLVHDTDHELDEIQLQHAAEDRQRFIAKWGQAPW
jgi:hypothetical protein